ncbi:MAG TPA: sugar ABC transporter ATP-binding protein [Rectinemataceae bacterium]
MAEKRDLDGAEVILRAIGLSKSFPGVKALTDVDFDVRRGEVVALLGENGAGKSTLIKILCGVYQCDSGYLELEGKRRSFEIPMDAKNAGIGVVHQELNYVPSISVAENIFMSDLPRRGIFVDQRRLESEAKAVMARIGLDLDPRMLLGKCTVAQKQLIEIAKVMAEKVKVLILDEPTSSLNDVETKRLFELVDTMASMGVAVIYISHKLDELFRVADRVVVLRDGVVTGQVRIAEATKDQLISMMVGRTMSVMYPKRESTPGEVALEVSGLCSEAFKDIGFKARKGTIFGIYGLLGSGHLEIGPTVFGQLSYSQGEIRVDGKPVKIDNPLDALRAGIAYVPAERKVDGLVLNASVNSNIMISYYALHKRRLLDLGLEESIGSKWIENLKIKTPSGDTRTEALSGGNQQKVVLSRWLELEPEVLILNEPTRGIDVGAKAEIYRILQDLCALGKCVIMITSEMPELLNMSDEIMVLHEGRVMGIMSAKGASQEEVLRLAIGG